MVYYIADTTTESYHIGELVQGLQISTKHDTTYYQDKQTWLNELNNLGIEYEQL